MMASLLNTFNALDLRKKIVLGLAVLATLALVMFVARGATQPTMSLLYGGLDVKAAGEVVGALDQLGVKTEVRGDAIYVPISERDRVRLALAKEGLPAQGQGGYELLEKLSGFATSQQFEAAYWRAKEGELARTIGAVPGVKSARVHIGASARRPFSRSAEKSTAAVTVTTTGGPLSNSSALSIRYLVALAVSDLDPTQVAVIDARHGVVLRPGEDRASPLADENADRRAARLKEELERLLAVRVGEGNVRISVTVETTSQSETVQERIIDPESRVTMSSQTEESTEDLASNSAGVTVASNLPDGDQAQPNDGRSKRENAKESVTYGYSQTQRNRVVEAGAVKRIGVAVLVNEVEDVQGDGSVVTSPRSAEELAAIEDLVKSAVAFDSERGDVVTVESMRFADEPALGSEAEAGLIEQVLANNMVELLQGLILAGVAIVLGLFVVRPILNSAAEGEGEGQDQEDALAIGEDGEPIADENALALEGEQPAALGAAADPTMGALPTPEAALGAGALTPMDPATSAAVALSAKAEEEEEVKDAAGKTVVDKLREAVDDKTEESVALLKRWLHAPIEQIEGER